jgi:putative salt-induced outer membrane protein YdiY
MIKPGMTATVKGVMTATVKGVRRMKKSTVIILLLAAGIFLVATGGLRADDKLAAQVDESIKATGEAERPGFALLPGWLIDLSAGYSMNQGNSDNQNLLARAAVIKKFAETWELIGKGEYAWGKVKDQVTEEYEQTADRGQLSGQANLFLIEDGFLYGRSEYSYDKIKELDRRLDSGVGVGYNVYRSGETYAALEAGAAYIDSKYEDGQRDHGIFLRLAQNGALKINERVTFIESVEYKPKFEDFNDYLLNAEAALRVSLMGNLYFQLTVTDRYDNQPAAGTKRNDLSMIGSLGLSI